MKFQKTILIVLIISLGMLTRSIFAAEVDIRVQEPQKQDVETKALTLPKKGTAEYWVIRSQAMTEFIPFLTKKRSETKTIKKMLADYLLKIEEADNFAKKELPVEFNPKIYMQILRINETIEDMNIDVPKERPSWDQLVEIAMQHALYEGFWPTDVDADELQDYIDICKKKEEYGQKVRNDLRKNLDQCAKMWVYLDQIKKLGEFKASAADVILEKKAAKTSEKARYTEMHREALTQRAADREQRQFEDREARASFRSSRQERLFNSRQDRLRYRQSRLDERYVNSRAYYY